MTGTSKRRIAVVRHERYPLDQHLRRDVLALRDAGFEIDLICDSETGRPRFERSEGLNITRLPLAHAHGGVLRYLFEYSAWPLLAAAILALRTLRKRYDYVEIRTMPDWLIVAALVPKLRGATIVLYMLENMPELMASDYDLPLSHPIPRLLVVIERVCAKLADHIIAAQEALRRIMVKQGLPEHKMIVVPNAPDERVFLTNVPNQGRDVGERVSRNAWRGEGTFRLATHGSLLERYGIQTLIEAVAVAHPLIPGIRLDVIGEGEFRPTLEALAKSLNLEKVVFFHDFVPFDQVAPRLLHADVGVVAMWVDGMPNKLVEYLALAIPVIASDRPSMRVYFDDTALCYVPPQNAPALAEAIVSLYRDPDRRARLAARGHEVFNTEIAWRKNIHTYLDVYDADTGETGSGPSAS